MSRLQLVTPEYVSKQEKMRKTIVTMLIHEALDYKNNKDNGFWNRYNEITERVNKWREENGDNAHR